MVRPSPHFSVTSPSIKGIPIIRIVLTGKTPRNASPVAWPPPWLRSCDTIYQTFISAPITVGDTIPGDANNDGNVDANDIVAIINFLMGKDVPGFNADKADANGDGSINAADIVTIVGKIL